MSFPNSTQNPQPLLFAARCVTSGTGTIATPIPQQNVGAVSWTFDGVDPTQGQIRLNLAQRLPTTDDGAIIGIFVVNASQSSDAGTNPVPVRVQQTTDTVLLITVGTVGGLFDLSTDIVEISLIGLVPL